MWGEMEGSACFQLEVSDTEDTFSPPTPVKFIDP